MSQLGASNYPTLTVLRSEAMGRADGRVSILLTTKEKGPIAFEVDQQAIDGLRQHLAIAEHLLRQTIGQRPS
jgi:hypothetical protein